MGYNHLLYMACLLEVMFCVVFLNHFINNYLLLLTVINEDILEDIFGRLLFINKCYLLYFSLRNRYNIIR